MNDRSSTASPVGGGDASRQSWPLVTEFLDHLRAAGMNESCLHNFPGPVKHLLVWLDRNGIEIGAIDGDVLRRFLTHSCDCPRPPGARYQSRHMRKPNFKNVTHRFVCFLEQTGRIANPSSLDEGMTRIAGFTTWLTEQGYASGTVHHYGYACRHFVTWLHQHRIPLADIDGDDIERFARHDCFCPGQFTCKGAPGGRYHLQVKRFTRFLAENGVIVCASSPAATSADEMRGFRDWLRRHRGIKESTIRGHVAMITRLLPQLGNDPARYDAALVGKVILENLETGSVSRVSAQHMCGSLRMYLRFLASRGACAPALVDAVPRIPRWRMATLPRYILADDVERVIASCDLTTPRGLRDRAILLLLARLALRGGDIVGLHLEDVDWENARITVAGKTKHAVALPLPQDVGDALLDYIEDARPTVASSRVFLRSIAPFVPFSCSGSVAGIVRDALKRAGVDNPNLRGAHLLRHSAATNMLRSGATLDAVGALLRHRSPETTAIYAKVDTTMLMQVAQPWIGRES